MTGERIRDRAVHPRWTVRRSWGLWWAELWVPGIGRISEHRVTHAEAIAYADSRAREGSP